MIALARDVRECQDAHQRKVSCSLVGVKRTLVMRYYASLFLFIQRTSPAAQ